MALFDEVVLTDSVEIQTTPDKVFDFLTGIRDDESYRTWHPEDHVAFRWLRGEPWQVGSVAYAEEYLHGKLHKLKLRVTEVVPNRKIVYAPPSRLLRFFFPHNVFLIEPKGEACVFTATGSMRIGRLARALAGKKVEDGIQGVRKHMKEEGERLKQIQESS